MPPVPADDSTANLTGDTTLLPQISAIQSDSRSSIAAMSGKVDGKANLDLSPHDDETGKRESFGSIITFTCCC